MTKNVHMIKGNMNLRMKEYFIKSNKAIQTNINPPIFHRI